MKDDFEEPAKPAETAIKGTPLTTVKHYDPRVKARAYELYLLTDMTPKDISIDLQVAERVILAWAVEGKWLDRKQQLEVEALMRADNSYRRFMADKRPEVAQRHVEIAEKMQKAITTLLDQALTDPENMKAADIKRLAEALASVTGVDARAVGIGTPDAARAMALAQQRGLEGGASSSSGGNNRQPVLVVNLRPTVPADKEIKQNEGKVIDVT